MGRSVFNQKGISKPFDKIYENYTKNNKSNQTNKVTQSGEIYGPFDYLSRVVNFNDFNDELYNKYYGEGTSGYTPYTPIKADISALLKAYEDQANSLSSNANKRYADTLTNLENAYNTSRSDAETSYKNTRSDLLTSLKRYQEQFNKDTAAQRQAFLTNQAALESTREAANRSVRNSMAARGLGGSGLQQLALLQNVLGQSSEVSKLATQNQKVIDDLRDLLNQKQEDYDTDMARLQEGYDANLSKLLNQYNLDRNSALSNRDMSLNEIAANLTAQKESAIANNEMAYADAVNRAREYAASYKNQAKQNATNLSNQVINAYNSLTASLASELKNLSSTKDAKTLAEYANAAKLLTDKDEAYTAKTIKKLNEKEKTELKQLIARKLASNSDTLVSQYSIDYGTPVSFNQNAQKNINNLLLGYGFNPYYTDNIINGKYINP